MLSSSRALHTADALPVATSQLHEKGRYAMFLVVLLVLVILAIGGGIVVSKFLFLLLIAAIAVAVFSRMGRRSTT
jgi:hypothetical protein